MNYKSILLILLVLVAFSCTTEETLFEKSTWWDGHWQNTDEPTLFFSSGTKRVGFNEIVTSQFFFSKNDSILENFHVEELIESDHKDKFKLMETSKNSFFKIQEIDESHIDIHGPTQSVDEVDNIVISYRRLPENIEPPIPDSILFER